MEIWKDIKGFENAYQISNSGKVRSLAKRGRGEIIMKSTLDKAGYCYISLRRDMHTIDSPVIDS